MDFRSFGSGKAVAAKGHIVIKVIYQYFIKTKERLGVFSLSVQPFIMTQVAHASFTFSEKDVIKYE